MHSRSNRSAALPRGFSSLVQWAGFGRKLLLRLCGVLVVLGTLTTNRGFGEEHRIEQIFTPSGGGKVDDPGFQQLAASGPLKASTVNPRYFEDGRGRIVYLVGSHTWANLLDLSSTAQPFDFDGYLRFMAAHKFNFMRLWTFWFSHNGLPCCETQSGPFPWLRPGPGDADDDRPRFDLSRLNPAYFDRLRARIIAAGHSGIYVSVMLFEGYEFQFADHPGAGDPFDGANNINGVSCAGTCPTDMAQMPDIVWHYEQAYLRKLVDTVNDLDNVLYEVSNEAGSPYSDTWQASVIRYVKEYEATKPKRHPVGMTFQYKGGNDATLYASDADWVSPGTPVPPPASGRKVVINDTDHSLYYTGLLAAGLEGQREWVWENFTRGNNVAFMDPYLTIWPGRNTPNGHTVDSSWDEIRSAMTDVQSFAAKIDLARMTPQACSSETDFCLANPGLEYLVYHPTADQAQWLNRVRYWRSGSTFELTAPPGTYDYEWFDPSTHGAIGTGRINVETGHRFVAPTAGASVLWLHRVESR